MKGFFPPDRIPEMTLSPSRRKEVGTMQDGVVKEPTTQVVKKAVKDEEPEISFLQNRPMDDKQGHF